MSFFSFLFALFDIIYLLYLSTPMLPFIDAGVIADIARLITLRRR